MTDDTQLARNERVMIMQYAICGLVAVVGIALLKGHTNPTFEQASIVLLYVVAIASAAGAAYTWYND